MLNPRLGAWGVDVCGGAELCGTGAVVALRFLSLGSRRLGMIVGPDLLAEVTRSGSVADEGWAIVAPGWTTEELVVSGVGSAFPAAWRNSALGTTRRACVGP